MACCAREDDRIRLRDEIGGDEVSDVEREKYVTSQSFSEWIVADYYGQVIIT